MPDFINYPFEKYDINVSVETRKKFNRYAELLLKWQKAINLISETTVEDMAERHFLDSVQLIKFIPDKKITLVDMGSGAGFPGMILAMLDIENVHLIESDIRKATFLREVSRETNTKVFIHDDRIENVHIKSIDLITARALAPLKDILTFASNLSETPVTILSMKGEKSNEEIQKAKKKYKFIFEEFQSITDKTGKILKINNFSRETF